MTTIKFPVLVKYPRQYNQLMDCLAKNGVKWSSGCLANEISMRMYGNMLPCYILYWNGQTSDYPNGYLTFLRKSTEEEENYFEVNGIETCTVTFEND